MANLEVRDGDASEKFLKATGTGATGDPFIVEHKETSATAIAASVASVDTKTPALGQALAAASVPVALPAAQITTLTPPAAITGFATAANQAAAATLTGAVDETAPATDTASSGLNGRLQRIAQRITSLIALIPAALTGSGNFKVAVQEALPAGDNNIGNVDIVTVPSDPFGANADAAATAGSAGTMQAKFRLMTTLLDAINTAAAAIKTAVEIIDNGVAGNEFQVDVITLPAIPAGTNNIGDVDVASVVIPTTFYMGQKTVTTNGTEVVLASSQALLSGVTVKALHANTGMIYVGTNPVTSSTGFVLDAGESIFIEVDNLADVYIDCSVNGEGVSYIGS